MEGHAAAQRAAPRLDGAHRGAPRRERRDDLRTVPRVVEMLVDVVAERRRAVVVVPGRVEVRDGVGRPGDDRAAGRGAARCGLSDAGTDGRRDDRHDAAEGTEAPSRSNSTHEFLFLLSLEDVLETAQPPTYVRRRTRRVVRRTSRASANRRGGRPDNPDSLRPVIPPSKPNHAHERPSLVRGTSAPPA